MLADTSGIHKFSASQHTQATDLAAVAAELTAAILPPDAFGLAGARFQSAFNAALAQHADQVAAIADWLSAAAAAARTSADAYSAAEGAAAQTISTHGD